MRTHVTQPVAVTHDTACPLDCPDSCSLSVTVQDGRLVKIDGSTRHAVTGGYICAKVRRFDEHVYGDARVRHPVVRAGTKGEGRFTRVTWEEALDLIAGRMREIRARWGSEAILPFSYGGSNGLLSQDTTDAILFRRFGASRLVRTVCAAPTGAANQAMYGKMPSASYLDYPESRLIVIWGANPSASGVHLVPYVREAQRRGAALVVIDPRATPLARQADVHVPVRPGTDVAVALAVHRFLFESGRTNEAFLAAHATGVERLRERAAPWTFERAAEVSGVDPTAIARFAELYARLSPAVIRCGWGPERNRNGGNATLAILALPAVAGKFGVRGGGFTMSNSASWSLTEARAKWIGAAEPPTRIVNMNHLGRALLEYDSPPVQMLFVYNCNPAVTMPDQNRVLRGLQREDLFTVVFDQVLTDTATLADVVLPATTFLEQYDIARAYGPLSLQLVKPAIEPVGEARTNAEVFAELTARLGLADDGGPSTELEMLLRIFDAMPPAIGQDLRDDRLPAPAFGRAPIQFVDVFPRTPDGKIHLFPADLEASAAGGLYAYQADPATEHYPLALISPSSDKTISSTMGELRTATARLLVHPTDASSRGLSDGDDVRVFNERGEVQCFVTVGAGVRPGTVVLPKGLWRKSTLNGLTANALAPDCLTDLGDGACFNDARVQVEKCDQRGPLRAVDRVARLAP